MHNGGSIQMTSLSSGWGLGGGAETGSNHSFDDIETATVGTLDRQRKLYSTVRMLSGKEGDKDGAVLLYEKAIELFDPFHLGYITEEQCMAAICLVYKEHRYAASSLNDYGELHSSLRNVIDVVFWTMMAVILQAFLELNIYSYFLPFVTLALTLSFALGPLLGNLLLAIAFVFFMVPYEVGNKVFIGTEGPNRIVGWVRGISLLHTTITTVKNEVVSVPSLYLLLCAA
jgi:hypothetical protein